MPNVSRRHRVVIAGGGVAALEALITLHRLAAEEVEVTLVAPGLAFTYQPLSVTAPFAAAESNRIPLAEVAHRHGATHQRGLAAAVDAASGTVTLADGAVLPYDSLLLATGTRAVEAVPGALTYRGDRDAQRFGDLLAAVRDERARRLAFVVPAGCHWPLPMYELALMTAAWAARAGRTAELAVVTAEPEPLGLFGAEASGAVRDALAEAGVLLRTGSCAEEVDGGRLWLDLEGAMRVDRAIALPRQLGRAPAGLPADAEGFIAVDALCRVVGTGESVYAAGDMTVGPIKQGGLATQQADTAAEAIAQRAGATVHPAPYQPVLRGMLLTGDRPLYLRRPMNLGGGLPTLAHEPLWWPPHKIVGRELAPYLAANLDLACPDGPDNVTVDIPVRSSA